MYKNIKAMQNQLPVSTQDRYYQTTGTKSTLTQESEIRRTGSSCFGSELEFNEEAVVTCRN